jgi:aspartyl-tRNA(Asn)/glutamyl-tRNA(Gln) amidotransferase subunit A
VQRSLELLTMTELSALFADRSLSPVELTRDCLDRIARYNPVLHSFITVSADRALDDARRAEREIARGERRGPLHGIPVAHKDVLWTEGVRTTAHSRTMLDLVPGHDATAVRRLRDAGTVLVGKTNTTEFACGGLDLFGTPRNPWDLSRYTGGSSNGSASAVAAGLVPAATGSDTGGSIRAPSCLCGIVGLKPTYGRVSRFGLVPLSWSMDHVGPMARSVADVELLLDAMSGADPLDPSTVDVPRGASAGGGARGVDGLVLGVPQGHFYSDLDPGVDAAVRAALAVLESLGARLEAVDLPRAASMLEVGQVLMYVESFALHAARLRRQARNYSARARRRIASGAFYSAADYQEAGQLRELWLRDLAAVFERVDALVTPTVKFPAFPVELQERGTPPDTGLNTRPFSVSGHPALSVPCGFTPAGLPVGMQIVGRPFDEEFLFRIGTAYEQTTGWRARRPVLEAVG